MQVSCRATLYSPNQYASTSCNGTNRHSESFQSYHMQDHRAGDLTKKRFQVGVDALFHGLKEPNSNLGRLSKMYMRRILRCRLMFEVL